MVHTKHQKIRLDLFGEGVSIPSASSLSDEPTNHSGDQSMAEPPSANRDPSGVIPSAAGKETISDPPAEKGQDLGKAEINTQADSKTARRKAYNAYIKGEGREFYTEDMQNIVSKRVKDAKELRARVDKLDPLANAVAKKYGIDPLDTDALTLAVLADSVAEESTEAATMEKPAAESVEEATPTDTVSEEGTEEGKEEGAKETLDKASDKTSEAPDADDLPWEDSDDANIGEHLFLFDGDHLLRIGAEAEEMKLQYPGFDLWAEAAADPIFVKLLGAGISVEEAYLARHHKEIVTRAVADARAETEKAVVDNIRARGRRPVEGGANTASAPQTGYDVRNLTREQRAEIARQATIGKRIEFI